MDHIKCMGAFKVSPTDRLVLIKEQHLADASFVISYLMKQSLQKLENKLVLILTHNSLGHFQCIGKRLGYDIMQLIDKGVIVLFDVTHSFLSFMPEKFLEDLHTSIEKLEKGQGETCIFVDDMSHFLDLGLSPVEHFNFTNALLSSALDCQRARFIIGTHAFERDNLVLDLEYNADVVIDVSTLKTGRSKDVTGLINVIRAKDGERVLHHYKAKEVGVQVFKPGELLRR